jgi:hypothetical protein
MPTARPLGSIARRCGIPHNSVHHPVPVKALTQLGLAVAKYVLPSKSSPNRTGERSILADSTISSRP